jgi:hypothetical protein
MPETDTGNIAFNYYEWLASAPVNDINQEIHSLKQNTAELNPIVRSVQMALLLSVPENATPEDEHLAIQLLNQIGGSEFSPVSKEVRDYRLFARVWKDVLLQRRELRGIINNLIQRLQEENGKYTKQIEALKLIEQQANDRAQ